MPYASNAALPEPIRHALPVHAQDIYRAAFNNAFASYRSSTRREEIAHRVAWAAVKKVYAKRLGKWQRVAGSASRTRAKTSGV
ncbi:MAG: ChaB family protein [Alphaproteobacteria bacterium]|nr:ChaB family protein [Alphaproteobacteria bacterium]